MLSLNRDVSLAMAVLMDTKNDTLPSGRSNSALGGNVPTAMHTTCHARTHESGLGFSVMCLHSCR